MENIESMPVEKQSIDFFQKLCYALLVNGMVIA